jgi:hypothetical protein
MQLRGAKPGRFSPSCGACRQKFVLIVPAEEHVAPTVQAMAEALPVSISIALGIEEPAMPRAPALHDAETKPAHVGLAAPPPDIPPTAAPVEARDHAGADERDGVPGIPWVAQARRVRASAQARSRRHGRGLHGASALAGPKRRAEGPAPALRRGPAVRLAIHP